MMTRGGFLARLFAAPLAAMGLRSEMGSAVNVPAPCVNTVKATAMTMTTSTAGMSIWFYLDGDSGTGGHWVEVNP